MACSARPSERDGASASILSPDSFGRPDGAVLDSWETFVPICPYLDLTTGFGWRVLMPID